MKQSRFHCYLIVSFGDQIIYLLFTHLANSISSIDPFFPSISNAPVVFHLTLSVVAVTFLLTYFATVTFSVDHVIYLPVTLTSFASGLVTLICAYHVILNASGRRIGRDHFLRIYHYYHHGD